MRIEVIQNIDTETREVWTFNMFDLNCVFIAWHREVKPKGKRKWTIEAFWDKYGRREYTMVAEPILPDVRSQYIYLCEMLIKGKGIRLSWTSVCQYVGYGDHTMYFSSLRKACDLIDSDKTYRQQVEQIQSEILNYINSQPLKVAVSKI